MVQWIPSLKVCDLGSFNPTDVERDVLFARCSGKGDLKHRDWHGSWVKSTLLSVLFTKFSVYPLCSRTMFPLVTLCWSVER